MKKLLSLLSVLTISGTAVPTTIAASPYQKEKQLNRIKRSKIHKYFDDNNSGKMKSRTVDKVINQYKGLGHNYLILQIDSVDFQDICFFKDIHPNNDDALLNKIFKQINTFPKIDNTGLFGKFTDDDLLVTVNVIIDHFEEIRIFFVKNNNKGLTIRTNRNLYWSDSDSWWGVHVDTGNWWE